MTEPREKTSLVSEQGKDVALKADTELTEATFFEGAGDGTSDFAQSDFTVPFIGILQALSKPLQKGHSRYNKEADQGQFLNSATGMLYDGGEPGKDKNGKWNDGGIIAVPAFFHHRYIAWKPNNAGISHDFGSDSTLFDSLEPATEGPHAGKRLDPDGNEVIDAMEYFCLLINPETESVEAAVIPFSKIHTKKAKKWNNLIRAHVEINKGKPVKPAIYFYAYKITTIPESNDKGSWYSHNIEDYAKLPDLGDFGTRVFRQARELREQVKSGALRAATEEPDNAATGDGDGAF
jgi:hypothetical protein